MKLKFNNRVITDISISGIDSSDAPRFCDAFIESAIWDDTSLALTESELDELNNDQYLVHTAVEDWVY